MSMQCCLTTCVLPVQPAVLMASETLMQDPPSLTSMAAEAAQPCLLLPIECTALHCCPVAHCRVCTTFFCNHTHRQCGVSQLRKASAGWLVSVSATAHLALHIVISGVKCTEQAVWCSGYGMDLLRGASVGRQGAQVGQAGRAAHPRTRSPTPLVPALLLPFSVTWFKDPDVDPLTCPLSCQYCSLRAAL